MPLISQISPNIFWVFLICEVTRHADIDFCFLVRPVEAGVCRAAVGEHDFQKGAQLWPGLLARWHRYTHLHTPSSSCPLCVPSAACHFIHASTFACSNMIPVFHPQLLRKCATYSASMWPTSHEPSCLQESRSENLWLLSCHVILGTHFIHMCPVPFSRLVGTMCRRPRLRSRPSLQSRLWPKPPTRGCSAGWSWESIRPWIRPRGREPLSLVSWISLDLRSLRYI